MGHWLRSKASKVIVGAFALIVVLISFQLGTHRSGILPLLAQPKRFLSGLSTSPDVRPRSASPSTGAPHSVSLSWKASPSAVVGYNVYRRGRSGLVKLNSVLVSGTSYVDSTVQSGQTYYYVIKAVGAKGAESTASNEIRADIPSP